MVPPSDDQPTVITRRPPLSTPSNADTLSPFEKWGLRPGDRLGHFNLVELVGGGGMGRVYRALDTRLARTVALKVLSPDQAADGNTLLRFQNEAQSAARLDHPNIARVYYVGEDRGIPFIVFEFIEGVNIRDLVAKRGPLPLGEAVSYMLQVTAGLAHAAGRDVVHRDIKPSNILITPEGTGEADRLGLARLQRFEGPGGDLTASGVTLGTFDYISPEQARDPRDGRRSQRRLFAGLHLLLHVHRPAAVPAGHRVAEVVAAPGRSAARRARASPGSAGRSVAGVAEDAGERSAASLSESTGLVERSESVGRT